MTSRSYAPSRGCSGWWPQTRRCRGWSPASPSDADAALEAITAARAAARERVSDVAGAPVQDGKVVIDLDATLLDAHSEKEDASRTRKNSLNFC